MIQGNDLKTFLKFSCVLVLYWWEDSFVWSSCVSSVRCLLVLFTLTVCNSIFVLFRSVAFQSALSCVDNLDESRSTQLKNFLSDYFDKRRDKAHALKPVDIEELDKYKVRPHTVVVSFS